MAVYTGAKFETSDYAERPNEIEAIRERYNFVGDWDGLDAPEIAFGGSFTNNLPITMLGLSFTGATYRSFYGDFYNRLYFLPSTVNFGAISGDTPRVFRVWNAYLASSILQSIELVNAVGLTLASPVLPNTMTALEITEFTVTASDLGPPSVAATFNFIFDTPEGNNELYPYLITGQRAKIAPLIPNWRTSYKVVYQFKTEVITSHNGKEQRRALRTTPRKNVEFGATPARDDFRALNQLMLSWHNNVIVIPEVPRQAVIAAPLLSTDEDAVLASTAPSWMVANALVVVAYKNTYETRRIASAVGTAVAFDGSGTNDYPVGAKIHPALAGRLAASVRAKRLTSVVATVAVVHEVTPASEPVVPLDAAEIVFNGREVLMHRFNWGDAPEATYESEREEVDYGRGRVGIFTPYIFSTRMEKITFVGVNFADADGLRQHFERMKGQRGEFYMPTWEPDIVIVAPAGGGTRDLRVAGTTFFAEHNGSTIYKAVCIFLRTGVTLRYRVDSLSTIDDAGGTDSVVTLDADLPYGIDPTDVKFISWMPVWRHATDTMTMEWLTSAVAQCQFTVRTLEDL